MPQNAVELADKYGEKINGALEQLAAKVGVGVDHFWPILVNQQRMEGIISASLWSFTALVVCGLFIYAFKSKNKLFRDDFNRESFAVCAGVLIAFFLGIAVPISGTQTITQIFNPEYFALQDIAKMIK